MKILAYRVDDEGYFVEDVLIEENNNNNNDNVVYVSVPDGMVKPFWDGNKWVEKGEITSPDNNMLPDIAERLKVLEDTVLLLLENDMNVIEE